MQFRVGGRRALLRLDRDNEDILRMSGSKEACNSISTLESLISDENDATGLRRKRIRSIGTKIPREYTHATFQMRL